ncbi:MAG: SDR family oxidoreductase [Solirubrobacterales bacterium]
MSARVALVTGGARGIGGAIAQALAERGCAVAIGDLLTEQADELAAEIRAGGGNALAVKLDVTDADSVSAAVAEIEAGLGPIEILVNNAGWDELMLFLDTDEAFWDRVIAINYKGCLQLTHTILPGMIERGFGRIVNIGSDAGRVGSSMEAVYAGAKGAVIAFTKTIAREAARSGVTANVVCPGPTDTPLLAEIVEAQENADKVIGAMTRAVPMKRLGQPREVAAAVAFFVSDDAGYITGQTLSVSGGLTMM